MKLKRKLPYFASKLLLFFGALFSIHAVANMDNHYASEFKEAAQQSCDDVFHQLEPTCNNAICKDILVNTWAECWKRSMNKQLNMRLSTLKTANTPQFRAEQVLQKSFNQATRQLCGKSCGADGAINYLKYNICRVDAYKYRTAQLMAIGTGALSVPIEAAFLPSANNHPQAKDTQMYHLFVEKLCALPGAVWKNHRVTSDCQRQIMDELNHFKFTDDVCTAS